MLSVTLGARDRVADACSPELISKFLLPLEFSTSQKLSWAEE